MGGVVAVALLSSVLIMLRTAGSTLYLKADTHVSAYVCVCVCVCAGKKTQKKTQNTQYSNKHSRVPIRPDLASHLVCFLSVSRNLFPFPFFDCHRSRTRTSSPSCVYTLSIGSPFPPLSHPLPDVCRDERTFLSARRSKPPAKRLQRIRQRNATA